MMVQMPLFISFFLALQKMVELPSMKVGRCSLTVSKPVVKAPMVSTLETMTKCVEVLRAKAKAKSMDQSRARIWVGTVRSELVIGPSFPLLLCSVTL